MFGTLSPQVRTRWSRRTRLLFQRRLR